MNAVNLGEKEVDVVILALEECYRRLKITGLTAKELTQDGFTLMFKSAYQSVTDQTH